MKPRCRKKGLFTTLSVLLALVLTNCTGPDSSENISLPETVDFNFHIKPLLSDRCFKCHGPDEEARKADLRFDIKEAALSLLDTAENRFAIVPGDLKNSSVVHRITSTDPEFMMPPPESNLGLSKFEIDLIKRWIDQGAEWKPHWSFIKPEKQALPEVKEDAWPQSEIDHFILSRLEQEGLKPETQATKEKWFRRASFDLTGLPPTTEDIDAFLKNESEEAFEIVVDSLLSSPAYGERMASIWLDAARYADSHGYQDDRPRTMWPWRDWVIDAFNSNMPYDSFTVWQLAGDLLPNANYSQKLATGFNRNHAITQEGGVVNEEYITEYVADRTNTTSTAFLGLTMECARCHDHKYDPIAQKDYYSLFAFFNGIDERGQINYFDESPKPNMKVEDEELEAIIDYVDKQVSSLENKSVSLKTVQNPEFRKWLVDGLAELDPERYLPDGLMSHHKLDQVKVMKTRDEVSPERPARMNTGLLEELDQPELTIGHLGKALQFDGANFLNLGDIGDFDWYQPFSMGAWIQAPAYLEKDAGLLVRRNGEQKRGGYELALTSDGRLGVRLIYDQSTERIDVQTRASISSGKWTHVFYTYDGSGKAAGINIFLNGRSQNHQVLQDQLDRKSILTGNDLLAGNWNHRKKIRNDIHGFKGGKIDEIRVYDRELSPLEVLAIAGRSAKAVLGNGSDKISAPLQRDILLPHFLLHYSTDYKKLQAQLYNSRRDVETVPHVMIMEEMDTVRETFILARGAYDAPIEKVTATPPPSVMPFEPSLPANRLGLAQWIVDPENPLTSRVMVNRLWQLMFGRGIVQTPEDFGSQGALPTHPKLLDWLAVDFVESGWNIKDMLKKIALSATYRQSAAISPEKFELDPENILVARGPNQRLSAEMIRDHALTVSDLLVDSIGGKWVKSYQPPGIWKELANQIGENKYRAGVNSELYRRSLYSYWKRTIPPPTMLTFDASERALCVVKRQATSTPLQSLVLLNDPQYVEASRLLASRMIGMAAGKDQKGIEYGFRAVTSRKPAENELKVLSSFLEKQKQVFANNPDQAKAHVQIGQMDPDPNIDPVELAAWTQVANTLLNLDEAKMK